MDDDGFSLLFLADNTFVENCAFLQGDNSCMFRYSVSIQKTPEVSAFGIWKALKPSDLLIDKENV